MKIQMYFAAALHTRHTHAMFRMGILSFVFIATPVLFTGCGGGITAPESVGGAAIQGSVFGGQQPVVGSRVYLLAAGTGGYGAASTSLLTQGISGSDSIGGYVLTGAGGIFSVSGNYTCTQGQQVYVLALGGDPTGSTSGTINNIGIGLMTALGGCPATGTVSQSFPRVSVNELTTVAAAYALAGFATDSSHIASSGNTQALIGVSNAFITATNLVDPASGMTYTATPSGGGTVPLAEIGTLGNILAACVNTTAASSIGCASLFDLARSAGATGVQSGDTASAMINIAHHPGTNIAGLYMLQTSAPPFQPALSAQPNDFTVAVVRPMYSYLLAFDSAGNAWTKIQTLYKYSNTGTLLSPATGYSGGGIAPYSSSSIYGINSLAIDYNDSVWAAGQSPSGSTLLSEFNNAGSPLSPTSGFTGNGLSIGNAIAVDGLGGVWVGNDTGQLSKFNNTGQADSSSPLGAYAQPNIDSLAFDSGNSLWFTSSSGSGSVHALTKISNSGALLATPAVSSSTFYTSVSVDSGDDVWGIAIPPGISQYVGVGNEQIFRNSSAGSPVNGFPALGNTGLQYCEGTAIDGDGNFWCATNNNSVAEMSPTGTSLSPDAGFQAGNAYGPRSVSIDNSGNVWTGGSYTYVNGTTYQLLSVELIGAAAPVVTPFSLGIKLGKLGLRP